MYPSATTALKRLTLLLFGYLLAVPSLHAQRGSHLMKALDTNGDGTLSVSEIQRATTSLRFLDEDGDGDLSAAEIGRSARFSDWGDMDDWGDMGDMGDWDMDGMSGMGGGGGRRRGGEEGPSRMLEPQEVDPVDGTHHIPDRDAYDHLSAPGSEILAQPGLRYVKFQLEDPESDTPRLYFINTKTHPAHSIFTRTIGKRGGSSGMRGALVYRPFLVAPNGRPGLYTFEFEMQDAFSYGLVRIAFDLLQANAPVLRERLAYHPVTRDLKLYREEQDLYADGQLPVFLDEDLYSDIGFLPLHVAESFGRLRLMHGGDRPGPRDIVIYATLPNEMPRVAGVITEVRQTPLSHVNLRAVQDGIPNAFLLGASTDPEIAALIGRYVSFQVDADGYRLREATQEEVLGFFASQRPSSAQTPPRDLSAKSILPLSEIGFEDASRFGVKSSNLAMLHGLALKGIEVPDGFAIPFQFYDAFMKHNGFYDQVATMMEDQDFLADADTRVAALKSFRKEIKRGEMPPWMLEALAEVQASFPVGVAIRCRSSTNNEDLPGFSGAGLYSSFTHHPLEGHLGRSVRQVYASLWNFRAFEERTFHRIDHLQTAMGVLMHPNFSGERANGVAVTEDILYQTHEFQGRSYLINIQLGEDLVTNPGEDSAPEELLLSPRFPIDDQVLRHCQGLLPGQLLLDQADRNRLRLALKTIHRSFAEAYGKEADDTFAMEVEFKLTAQGTLAIKQARPWVY